MRAIDRLDRIRAMRSEIRALTNEPPTPADLERPRDKGERAKRIEYKARELRRRDRDE